MSSHHPVYDNSKEPLHCKNKPFYPLLILTNQKNPLRKILFASNSDNTFAKIDKIKTCIPVGIQHRYTSVNRHGRIQLVFKNVQVVQAVRIEPAGFGGPKRQPIGVLGETVRPVGARERNVQTDRFGAPDFAVVVRLEVLFPRSWVILREKMFAKVTSLGIETSFKIKCLTQARLFNKTEIFLNIKVIIPELLCLNHF